MTKKLLIPHKQCSYCKRSYPLSSFAIKSHGKLGRASICEECKTKRSCIKKSAPLPKITKLIPMREGLLLLDRLKKSGEYRNTKEHFDKVVSQLNDCEEKNRTLGCGCDACPCKEMCVTIFDLRFA